MREFFTAPVANTEPNMSTRMPPAVPMRLMMALALDRRGFMVTSGISATAGDRKVAMAMRMMSSTAMNRIRVLGFAFVTSWA